MENSKKCEKIWKIMAKMIKIFFCKLVFVPKNGNFHEPKYLYNNFHDPIVFTIYTKIMAKMVAICAFSCRSHLGIIWVFNFTIKKWN